MPDHPGRCGRRCCTRLDCGDPAARDRLVLVVSRSSPACGRALDGARRRQPAADRARARGALAVGRPAVGSCGRTAVSFGVAAQRCGASSSIARARKMAKRSGQWARVTVEDARERHRPRMWTSWTSTRRSRGSQRSTQGKCQLTELRFFGGVVTCRCRRRARGFHSRRSERDWQAAASVVVQGITAGAPQ